MVRERSEMRHLNLYISRLDIEIDVVISYRLAYMASGKIIPRTR